MYFNLNNFSKKIINENGLNDTVVETVINNDTLDLYVTAKNDKVKFIELEWCFDSDEDLYVLGDVWERSYGELEFKKLCDNDRYMPWYFIATDKTKCFCFGVKTQPNAFISFSYTSDGIKALIDCRNGGCGVELNGRKLHIATFVYKKYDSADVYANLHDYCKTLCDNPTLPTERVYGGNNWYYAYGKSSYGEIISDTKLQAELAKEIENKPFEVIDDCWEINSCEGPWIPNEKFGDMKKLADEIREIGARPGIWVRLLHNRDTSITDEMRILRNGKREYLDPTHPEVKTYIKSDIERIKSWGYELLKHDFTTFDLFGSWGKDLNETITIIDDWHFYDRTKTNAEIVLDLYRLIKEAAGDMYIIGCNTVSHLCAGLVQINRTGEDTSGREWARTKKMGVNTLAFRLAQNEAFYMCDADCVGILDDNIPWEKNKQWLHLLSYSNTPLFVSCADKLTDEQKKDLTQAYRVYQDIHTIKPIDIFENLTPSKWEIDNKIIEYHW
ncbi:MAG: alpha-galactosidase [Ruminococcus bromii]|nr:alpha-galactosidase [Clostridia bacterium]MEE0896858.1 alpha-galactosidase [Acutalibacteraceae bacterium]MEE0965409.1 alpha-galactosidase [Ruminococcus bromii]MEE1049217.1 alpha-galactosidase [Clostridia bacterium]MEE1137129.1 alpha-galactosidase [Acutalibacteraceae bacterium]